jgi:NADH-quinone oxidoreductase subunit J
MMIHCLLNPTMPILPLAALGTVALSAGALSAILFYLVGGIAALSAVALVVSRNIVHTAVFLLFTLVSAAGIYFLLDAAFVAAVQMVIYVGGTLILIVFGVMLTARLPHEPPHESNVERGVAIAIGAVMLFALAMALVRSPLAQQPAPAETSTEVNHERPTIPTNSQSTPVWPGSRDATDYPVESIGRALLGDYLAPFELASVLLLLVMIGAAYLAKARRRGPEQITPQPVRQEAMS